MNYCVLIYIYILINVNLNFLPIFSFQWHTHEWIITIINKMNWHTEKFGITCGHNIDKVAIWNAWNAKTITTTAIYIESGYLATILCSYGAPTYNKTTYMHTVSMQLTEFELVILKLHTIHITNAKWQKKLNTTSTSQLGIRGCAWVFYIYVGIHNSQKKTEHNEFTRLLLGYSTLQYWTRFCCSCKSSLWLC